MVDISNIILPDGVTYNVYDANVPHTSITASSGGVDLSLVTTGEKYTWNNKSNLTIGTTATTASAGNHAHGSITNAGAITGTTALASGDGIIFADSSDSSKLKRSSITFDGSTTTKCLTQAGSWQSFTNNAGTVTSVKVGSTSYSPSSGVVSLPAYPTVNNATLTIQQNGSNVATFTANASSNKTANIVAPKISASTISPSKCTVRCGCSWLLEYSGTYKIAIVDMNILLTSACTSSTAVLSGLYSPYISGAGLCGMVDGSAQETVYGWRVVGGSLYPNGSRSNGGGWHIFGTYLVA